MPSEGSDTHRWLNDIRHHIDLAQTFIVYRHVYQDVAASVVWRTVNQDLLVLRDAIVAELSPNQRMDP